MKKTLLLLSLIISATVLHAQTLKKEVAKDIAERKADYAKTAEIAKGKPDTVYEVKEADLMKMLDLMTAGSQGVSTSKYFSEVQRESYNATFKTIIANLKQQLLKYHPHIFDPVKTTPLAKQ